MAEEIKERTCDSCGKLFKGKRRRWYCPICNKYFHQCPECLKKERIKCPRCGVRLIKKAEPIKK